MSSPDDKKFQLELAKTQSLSDWVNSLLALGASVLVALFILFAGPFFSVGPSIDERIVFLPNAGNIAIAGALFFFVILIFNVGYMRTRWNSLGNFVTNDAVQSQKNSTTQVGDKNNGKKNFGKLELAVVVSIISLIVSSIFAGYSVILVNQANDLTKQANSIAEKSLDSQLMKSNFTSLIIPDTERYGVFLDGGIWHLNETNPPVYSYGFCNGSITVITPRYGTVRVEVENFTAQDVNRMLEPQFANLTTVSVDMGYQYSNHDMYAVAGMNQLDFSIPLTALAYPSPQRLQDNYSPNIPTSIRIGILHLNATFIDTQNFNTTIKFREYVSIFINTTS